MVDNSITLNSNNQFDNNIIANLFTKCNDCKIRYNCNQHADKVIDMQSKIANKLAELNKMKIDKPNNIDVYKQIKRELKSYVDMLKDVFDSQLIDIECVFEKEDIIEDIVALQSKYNFKDPRVFILVKQYIKQAIVDFRAFKETSSKSLITYKYTEDGSKIPIINPIASYKLSSGIFIVKLIETIDKITKEDDILDELKLSGKGLFNQFLSKIPHVDIIDIPAEIKEKDI